MNDSAFPMSNIFEEIIKNPTTENAKRFSERLTKDNVQLFIGSGRENLILITILKQIADLNVRNKNEIKTHLIQAVSKIVQYSRVHTLISFKTILLIMLKEIYVETPGNATIQSNLSEELKISIINCFDVVFGRAASDIIEEFYTKENLNIIARIISTCVDIVSKENSRSLRMAGIKCMMSVLQVHNEADSSDIVLRDQIANVVFILLPKLTLTLINVAIGDMTQGQALISQSITALGRILRLIFEDRDTQCSISMVEQTKLIIEKALNAKANDKRDDDILKLTSKTSVISYREQQVENKEKTEEWLLAAARKLTPWISKLHKVVGSPHERIRKELVTFTNNLLFYCQKNIAPCVEALLEIKFGLTEDDNDSQYTYNDSMIDIAENLLLKQFIILPRAIYTGDEDDQMSNLSQLLGLISLLCKMNRIRITLTNEKALQSLVTILLSSLELDRTQKLLEGNQQSIYEISESNAIAVESLPLLQNNTPWKVYKNIRNVKLISKIEEICKLLSNQQPYNVFIYDRLLKLLRKNSANCNEVLVLFQLLLSNNMDRSIQNNVIDELLDDCRWTLATEANENIQKTDFGESDWYEDRTEGLYESSVSIRMSDIKFQQHSELPCPEAITINDVKFNILHICLVMETLGLYALELKEKFQPFLLQSLHRLLEKSLNKHYMIQISAMLALNRIKTAFGLNSVADLLLYNADYITYSINVSLKKAENSKTAITILSCVLQYCSLESMPHLENIIATVLEESGKVNQSINMLSFMELFRMILLAIRSKMDPENISTESNSQEGTENSNVTAISNNHCNWLRMLAETSNESELEDETINELIDTEDLEGDAASGEDESDEKKPKSILIDYTTKIMKRCIRNLSSKNREEKIIVLETLSIGLDIIKDLEDELLPLVHLIWEPFINQCIRDKNPVILRRCIQLLVKLAKYAKDFIYKRSEKELFPFILSYLKSLSKKCSSEYKGFSYEQTQEYKLLQELLSHLGNVLISLDIQERDLDNILEASIWLLDTEQPHSLRTNCMALISELSAFDNTAIHLKLLKCNKTHLK